MRCARTVRALCEKSAVFHHGSHGSQGPEFCTLQPLLVHQGFFLSSLMLAMGPRVLNSAPYSPCWYTRDFFCLV